MPNLTINQFKEMSEDATPQLTFTAPYDLNALFEEHQADYDFKSVLEALVEHETTSGLSHFYSVARWTNEHSQWGHDGATCLTLAYDTDAAPDVRAQLIGGDIAHYEFPIKAGRSKAVMFAVPLSDTLAHTQVFRASSLLAENIAVKGLIPSSYQSTYFFRFAPKAAITQRGTTILSRKIIELKDYVVISRWLK
jgi:hypothetical protein